MRWCWVVLCTAIEDYGCITSHEQSTVPKYFAAAGKSDVIHLIVVCWALLFQFFGGEHIVHIRWLGWAGLSKVLGWNGLGSLRAAG